MTVKNTLVLLIKAGFEAVNCHVPINIDDNEISIRNMFVEIDEKITCYSVENWEPKVIFSFPLEAVESAASAVVLKILSGMVSRAVENTWRELETSAAA